MSRDFTEPTILYVDDQPSHLALFKKAFQGDYLVLTTPSVEEGLEIIKINLKIEDLVKFSHKYNDEDYTTIEIAKLKSADKFGHDYTAYVNRLEESEVNEPAKVKETPKKKRNTSKKASNTVPSGDIPF